MCVKLNFCVNYSVTIIVKYFKSNNAYVHYTSHKRQVQSLHWGLTHMKPIT